MLKRYEVETIIRNALEDLDGLISKPDQYGKCTVSESSVIEDENGDLILTFKEDFLSKDAADVYRIKIEYL